MRESLFLEFTCLSVHKSNLLKARVIITTYNDHVRLVSPSLLVGFSTTNFTRAWEPTLSWNQLHSKPRPPATRTPPPTQNPQTSHSAPARRAPTTNRRQVGR